MIEYYLPLLLALLIGATYYLSNKFNFKKRSYHHKIVSFSAGVSITYVLLELFPAFTERVLFLNKYFFISVLVGFIAHHFIEKYIYQHIRKDELVKTLSLEDNVFSYAYHIILGILLVIFIKESITKGILFFIPVVSFTFVSMLPTEPHVSTKKAIILASSTLIGTLFATFIWTSYQLWIETLLIGIVLGILLYTVIRHHIPFGKKGRIGYFTIGFVLYSLLIIASWYI
ncbi:hypothetical protein COV17_01630 [Candidatus Woesearchaeota archaeon CG10_big_fil_rev_8_21_14_0_10_36_11]|nr:MAG: hypothetical protein COV17_01630 [Candidatus Woesearchaeota archaeon CG10_big_fil_rev_8_21_14_0_10_36_11]